MDPVDGVDADGEGGDEPDGEEGDDGDDAADDGDPSPADGASDGDDGPPDGDDDGEPSAPVENYLEPGTISVATRTESATEEGCTFEVGVFTPSEPRGNVSLVIAPGFALAPGLGSSRDALDALGEHVASWGVTTYTVALCTNGGSIDHAKNGAVMAAFGDGLGGPVVFAGFSAGGLGAMIAAASADSTRAYLALDAVDTNDLARTALDAITAPVHALAGEPSSCNSDENMLAQYEGRDIRVLKINMASHFIFEGAACTGIKCALCSGGGEAEAQAVRALATAFVLGASGTRPDALAWWRTGSEQLADLVSQGLVAELQ